MVTAILESSLFYVFVWWQLCLPRVRTDRWWVSLAILPLIPCFKSLQSRKQHICQTERGCLWWKAALCRPRSADTHKGCKLKDITYLHTHTHIGSMAHLTLIGPKAEADDNIKNPMKISRACLALAQNNLPHFGFKKKKKNPHALLSKFS